MAWTQEQVEALRSAVASGQVEVAYSDKRIRYHSLREMRALLAQMEHEMAAASGSSRGRELLRFKRD